MLILPFSAIIIKGNRGQEEIWIFVFRYVISPFHPSFVYIHLHKPLKRSVEFNVHCLHGAALFSVTIWMERTYNMSYKNPYFFVTTEPNWMGVFAEMQIISYSFVILKYFRSIQNFER